MAKPSFSFRNIPGRAVLMVFFDLLTFTGLHVEAIEQVQRLLLASGIRQADVPETPKIRDAEADLATVYPGVSLTMVDMQVKP